MSVHVPGKWGNVHICGEGMILYAMWGDSVYYGGVLWGMRILVGWA